MAYSVQRWFECKISHYFWQFDFDKIPVVKVTFCVSNNTAITQLYTVVYTFHSRTCRLVDTCYGYHRNTRHAKASGRPTNKINWLFLWRNYWHRSGFVRVPFFSEPPCMTKKFQGHFTSIIDKCVGSVYTRINSRQSLSSLTCNHFTSAWTWSPELPKWIQL